MALKSNDDDVDFSRSTGAFPMAPAPTVRSIDTDIDYSKSTNAFPMYDDAKTAREAAQDVTGGSTGAFPTPGPVSVGDSASVAADRGALQLTPDPSGASDAGAPARPSTVPVPGADGKPRTGHEQAEADAAAELAQADADQLAAEANAAGAKTPPDKAEGKVIEPPARPPVRKQTRAEG